MAVGSAGRSRGDTALTTASSAARVCAPPPPSGSSPASSWNARTTAVVPFATGGRRGGGPPGEEGEARRGERDLADRGVPAAELGAARLVALRNLDAAHRQRRPHR